MNGDLHPNLYINLSTEPKYGIFFLESEVDYDRVLKLHSLILLLKDWTVLRDFFLFILFYFSQLVHDGLSFI